MKHTYTFILELSGGTFVSQILAGNLETALVQWTEELTNNPVTQKELSPKVIDQIKISVTDQEFGPIQLDSLSNIWYDFLETDRGTGHVHIVLTATKEMVNTKTI